MKNIKQYIPILVFVVTLVLSGVTILTSKELEKRKYIPPVPTLAEGCTQQQVDNGTCHWADSIGPGKTWNWDTEYQMYVSPAESSDPSDRPQHEEAAAPPPPPAAPPPPPPPANTSTPTPTSPPTPTLTPTSTPTSTPTNTPTPTATATPTVTPTGTLTPTVTPTGTLTPTVTPTTTLTPTSTPIITPSPTQIAQAQHKVCINNTCQVVVGAGNDECQSDVSCQPAPVTPKVPTAATTMPTILSIIGGIALLIGGILLAL